MNDITGQAYHVEWFIHGEARRDVTIRFRGGRLVDVQPGHAKDAIDLGAVALVSGFVNAHTHLEFSRIGTPLPATGRFTDWIRSVVAFRREHPDETLDAIQCGIQESLANGVTLIGEIASSDWFLDQKIAALFHGTIFREVLGLLPDRIAQQQEIAGGVIALTPGVTEFGISPHAPYSTHWELVETAVQLAQKTGCPLAMHLAETRSELELLESGTGEFREMLQQFGIWRDDLFPPGRRPLDYLKLLSRAPRVLIIHGNYLNDQELSFLADHPQMTLVYCPRTHHHFGHEQHPWLRARQMGVKLALGTDSRASNPDLNLFAELQFIAVQHPELSHLDLLTIGSTNGRDALNGSSSADSDFTLIQWHDQPTIDPERQLFSPDHQVCGTMIGGDWRWLSDDMQQRIFLV